MVNFEAVIKEWDNGMCDVTSFKDGDRPCICLSEQASVEAAVSALDARKAYWNVTAIRVCKADGSWTTIR